MSTPGILVLLVVIQITAKEYSNSQHASCKSYYIEEDNGDAKFTCEEDMRVAKCKSSEKSNICEKTYERNYQTNVKNTFNLPTSDYGMELLVKLQAKSGNMILKNNTDSYIISKFILFVKMVILIF